MPRSIDTYSPTPIEDRREINMRQSDMRASIFSASSEDRSKDALISSRVEAFIKSFAAAIRAFASAFEPSSAFSAISAKASAETFSILSMTESTGIIKFSSTPIFWRNSTHRVLSPSLSLNSFSVKPKARKDSMRSAITSASAFIESSPRISALY